MATALLVWSKTTYHYVCHKIWRNVTNFDVILKNHSRNIDRKLSGGSYSVPPDSVTPELRVVANSVYTKISDCPSRVSIAQRSEHRYVDSETLGSIPGWDNQSFHKYNYDCTKSSLHI